MKSFNYCLSTFFFYIIICTGCNSNELQINRDNSTTKFRREIPAQYGGAYYLPTFYELPQRLNMKKIQEGFSDLQIRIWYKDAFVDTVQVLSLSWTEKKWAAEVGTIVLKYDDSREEVRRVGYNIQSKQPKSNWKIIEKAIINNDILNLPDYNSISGYANSLPTDGDVLTVEVADKNNYRIYSYPHPRNYQKYESVKKLVKSIEMFQREFDFVFL